MASELWSFQTTTSPNRVRGDIQSPIFSILAFFLGFDPQKSQVTRISSMVQKSIEISNDTIGTIILRHINVNILWPFYLCINFSKRLFLHGFLKSYFSHLIHRALQPPPASACKRPSPPESDSWAPVGRLEISRPWWICPKESSLASYGQMVSFVHS